MGGAYVIPQQGEEQGLVLNEWTGVLTAELVAIREAMRWANEKVTEGKTNKFIVLTDSRSSLQVVLHGDHQYANSGTREEILITARAIVRGGGTAAVGWVPSHCGVKGNERADAVAKRAAEGVGKWVLCLPTKAETKKEVNAAIRVRHQREWDAGVTGCHRHLVQQQLGERRVALGV
jgi:ribonuclease HI